MASWKKCIFEYPMCLNTQKEPVVIKCEHFLCRPCIHGWLEYQYQHVCPVCKSVDSENRLTPIVGSVHAIPGDVRCNVSFADQRIEPGAYSGYIFNFALCWTFVSTFIIILAILWVIYFII